MGYVEPTKKHFDTAQELIDEGWYQVSRRWRTVARLPDGKTGVQALTEAETRRDAEKWAKMLGEGSAGDHFLRCHANKDGLWKELDVPTFAAFRKLGGDTYQSAHYRKTKGK